jgi:hypothetical protein
MVLCRIHVEDERESDSVNTGNEQDDHHVLLKLTQGEEKHLAFVAHAISLPGLRSAK